MEQLNFTVGAPNISSSPGYPPPSSWDSRGLVPGVVLSLCFLLGVPGNIAVIILKPNREHLSSLSQKLMLNLAMSDLLCLLTLPLWVYTMLYSWTLGLVACKLLAYLVYCSIYTSMLTVTTLSVQRYLLVVHQQTYFNWAGENRLLLLIWLIAMILSIPSLVVRHLITDQHWTRCHVRYSSQAQWVVVLLTQSLLGFISFSVMAFAYIGLYRKVHQGVFFNNPQTTRMLTSIIVTFFVLWMPYEIINVMGVAAILLKNDSLMKFCKAGWPIAAAMTFVNSCLNPLFYAFAARNMCTVCQNPAHKYCC